MGVVISFVFEMYFKGKFILRLVLFKGLGQNYVFLLLKENMFSFYNLEVEDCEIVDFNYVFKVYKYFFLEYIYFKLILIKNCQNGLELFSEIDDKGEYNVENVFIYNC